MLTVISGLTYLKLIKKGEEVEITLLRHNMLVINNPDSSPTFESSRGRSWIDLTICGDLIADQIINWRVNDEESLSFHKIIEFEIKTDFEISRPVKYQYESTDWNTFNKCLHNNFSSNGITPDISIDDKSALDNLASQITSIFTDTIKSCIKSTTNFKNRRLVPWWSKEISQTRKSVNKAQKQYQKSKLPADLEIYRSFRNQYKYKIRKSKFENFKS